MLSSISLGLEQGRLTLRYLMAANLLLQSGNLEERNKEISTIVFDLNHWPTSVTRVKMSKSPKTLRGIVQSVSFIDWHVTYNDLENNPESNNQSILRAAAGQLLIRENSGSIWSNYPERQSNQVIAISTKHIFSPLTQESALLWADLSWCC